MKPLKSIILFLSFISFFFSFSSKINADIITQWEETSSTPYALASQTLHAINNKLYIIGGSAEFGVNKPKPIYSIIQPDNELGSWIVVEEQMPKGLIWHTSIVKDKYIYVLGGNENLPGSTVTDTVYRGIFDEDGSVISWISVSSLPKPLAQASAVVVGDKLYVSGGFSGNVANRDIYVATINPDGTLSDWINGGSLNESRFGHTFLEHNGYFYTIGGRDFNGNFFSTVYRQQANSEGILENTTPMKPLPVGVSRGSTVIAGSKIIVIGGETQSGATDKIYYADILPDGNISEWSVSTVSLPNNFCCAAAAVVGDYLYYVGGHDGANYFNTVYVTKLDLSAGPSNDLPVPLLKQTSEPWQGDIYDSANLWSPSAPTINRWGCAMTSATMVLNYNGITKMADGRPLNPQNVNAWLISQPDGYIGNGLINWIAISRLSKELKPHNPDFKFQALEYTRHNGMNNDLLSESIESGIPAILNVPGHFIVAKGKTPTSFRINDPFYMRESLEDGYNNEYLSFGRYVPSNTDLSYILLVYDEPLSTVVSTNTSESLGEEFYEDPIVDPVSGKPSGTTVKSRYVVKPETGTYTIKVTAAEKGNYTLHIYAYDKNGNVTKFMKTDSFNEDTEILYQLNFDKNSSSKTALTENKHIITFKDFYADNKSMYQTKKINVITYLLLNASIQDIENNYKKRRITQAVKKIDLLILVIKNLPTREASKPIKDILLKNLEGLKNYVKL